MKMMRDILYITAKIQCNYSAEVTPPPPKILQRFLSWFLGFTFDRQRSFVSSELVKKL